MNKKQAIAYLESINALPKGAAKMKAAELRQLAESEQSARAKFEQPARAYMPRQDLAKILRGFMEGIEGADSRLSAHIIPAEQLEAAGICPAGRKFPAYWSSQSNPGRAALNHCGFKGSFSKARKELRIWIEGAQS